MASLSFRQREMTLKSIQDSAQEALGSSEKLSWAFETLDRDPLEEPLPEPIEEEYLLLGNGVPEPHATNRDNDNSIYP